MKTVTYIKQHVKKHQYSKFEDAAMKTLPRNQFLPSSETKSKFEISKIRTKFENQNFKILLPQFFAFCHIDYAYQVS